MAVVRPMTSAWRCISSSARKTACWPAIASTACLTTWPPSPPTSSALRAIERYGVGTLDQAFAGYDALPPPGAANRPPWRKVLGIPDDAPLSEDVIQSAYRKRAMELHPDKGGSHDAMAALNDARQRAYSGKLDMIRQSRNPAQRDPLRYPDAGQAAGSISRRATAACWSRSEATGKEFRRGGGRRR